MRSRVRLMLDTFRKERPDLAPMLENDTWGHERTWMVGCVRHTDERGLPVETWTQKYMTALSLGPWRVPQQVRQKNVLVRAVGNAQLTQLPRVAVVGLPFRLQWQRDQARTLHSTLVSLGVEFDDLCARLSQQSGAVALELLCRLSGVKGYSKCLDFFVRGALQLDALPVDRHVRRYLQRFGLAKVSTDELLEEIRSEGYEPRLVARALHEQGVQRPAPKETVKC